LGVTPCHPDERKEGGIPANDHDFSYNRGVVKKS